MSCASFGLGYGSCQHCGTEDVFDNSRSFNGAYFCRAAECDAAGRQKLQRDEESLRAWREKEKREKEAWEAADARRRARWAEEEAAYMKQLAAEEAARQAEEDAIFQLAEQVRAQRPFFPQPLCHHCSHATDTLRLKKDVLLCQPCAEKA